MLLLNFSVRVGRGAFTIQGEHTMKSGVMIIGASLILSGAALAKDKHAAGGHSAPHWEYTGAMGAENWGDLSPDFAACGAGKMQSPIDIKDGFQADGAPFTLDYKASPLNIIHNGHTVQVNFAPGSSMSLGGKKYELLQVHFHTPSEHAIDGKRAPLEGHFVHKSAEGALAVLGVMMQEGAENPAVESVWKHLPMSAGPAQAIEGASVYPVDFFPPKRTYHRYMGSLTTPPCSEGVNWFVLTEPISISSAQLQKFAKATGENSRPLQPVNNRLVLQPVSAVTN